MSYKKSKEAKNNLDDLIKYFSTNYIKEQKVELKIAKNLIL